MPNDAPQDDTKDASCVYDLRSNGPGDFLLLGLILSTIWFIYDLYDRTIGP